jgi:hypothetical protein
MMAMEVNMSNEPNEASENEGEGDLDTEPLTEEGLYEMRGGPLGRPPLEVIEEFERQLQRDREGSS